MVDLYHAARDDLIALVLGLRDALADRERDNPALKAVLAQQRAAVAQLTAQVGTLLAAPGQHGAPGSRWRWRHSSAPGGFRAAIPSTPAATCSRPLKSGFLRRVGCGAWQPHDARMQERTSQPGRAGH